MNADRVDIMMTDQKITDKLGAEQDSIYFAELAGGVVAIRLKSRGNFQNSVELKRLADSMAERPNLPSPSFIVDLYECPTMDSTFMGVLASMALRQLKETRNRLTILNANDQNVRLLETLGLSHFMTIRRTHASDAEIPEFHFQCADTEAISQTERIVHMIEAHEQLCSVDPENNVRFDSVLKYLHESLDKQKQRQG